MMLLKKWVLALAVGAGAMAFGLDASAQTRHAKGCSCKKELQVRNSVITARLRAQQNQYAQQRYRQQVVRAYQQRLYRAYQQRLYRQYQRRYRGVRSYRTAARPARRKIKYNYVGGTRYTYTSIGSYYK